MPGQTPRGYPYPLGPEQAAGATDIQALGEAVDTDVGGIMPAGAIMAWAGASAPSGWQLCDGTLLSRAGFPGLFAAIGTSYGVGDGVSTFAAPNLSGRVVVAAGNGFALNATGGETTHTLTVAEMPIHAHTQDAHTHVLNSFVGDYLAGSPNLDDLPGAGSHNVPNPVPVGEGTTAAQPAIHNTGGGGAHNNMPPYLVLNYIIKL